MRRASFSAVVMLFLLATVWLPPARAQEPAPQAQKPAAAETGKSSASQQHDQAQASQYEQAEEREENAEFKQSASVQALARIFGLKPRTMYHVLLVLNFLIIAALIYWGARRRLPEMFRARTREIQKNLEESRRASEQAKQRLAEIEERLARLDSEIGALRAAAETDARAEEERLRAQAEADKRKIVEGAEQEIEAAAGAARRGLKAFAADLAVALAEKKIKVDPDTDKALVRNFAGQIKEGK
jgi:F-type H+-transporting ATPase subunit b